MKRTLKLLNYLEAWASWTFCIIGIVAIALTIHALCNDCSAKVPGKKEPLVIEIVKKGSTPPVVEEELIETEPPVEFFKVIPGME